MRARAIAALALVPILFAAVAAWAARTETGEVFNVPVAPWAALYLVGAANAGSVLIDDGTMVSEPAVALGGLAGGDGALTVTGAGSRLDINGDPVNRSPNLSCANEGSCLLEVLDGGAISINGAGSQMGDAPSAGMQIGFEAGSLGTARVSGPGSFLGVENGAGDLSGIVVGFQGDGLLVIEDGGFVAVDTGTGLTGGLVIGGATDDGDTSGVGVVTVTGAGSDFEMSGTNTSFVVGTTSTGTLEVLDGAMATGQVGFVGLQGSGDGTVRVGSGATLQIHGENAENGLGAQILVGMGGNGTLEVLDGTLEIDDLGSDLFTGLSIGGADGGPFTGGTGTVRVSGAAAQITVVGTNGFIGVGTDGDGTLLIEEGAVVRVENPDDASGASVGFQPGGSGRVDVSGEGSVFDAGVILNLGVDAVGSDAGSADLTVRDGGSVVAGAAGILIGSTSVLRGTGAVFAGAGLFNLRGRVEVGAPIGVLGVDGLYQQGEPTAASHFALSDAGESRLHVTGAVDLLAGTIEVDLIGGYLPWLEEFTLIDSDTSLALDPSVTVAVRGAAADFQFELEATETRLIFRALSLAQGLGGCQGGQLKALSKLCKRVFACESKRAKKPAKDVDGSGLAVCHGKANGKFETSWTKNFQKAVKKGDVCGIDDTVPAADVGAALVGGPAAEQTAEILTDWDEAAENKDDDKLRGKLLKSAGIHCSKLLTLDAMHMQTRNTHYRTGRRAKVHEKFVDKGDQAIQKAAAKGVVYTGPEPSVLADETTVAVGNVTTATFIGIE